MLVNGVETVPIASSEPATVVEDVLSHRHRVTDTTLALAPPRGERRRPYHSDQDRMLVNGVETVPIASSEPATVVEDVFNVIQMLSIFLKLLIWTRRSSVPQKSLETWSIFTPVFCIKTQRKGQ
ncbi:15896_t:CDS:2 [Funneliformis caledonium]|uniref:15896_t:CDS:1 n=1 Tax=Funneliformis caledonium TaxID=1117310 RepID=A0A9N9HTH6_9GLOM|nr:15896_t:CDS:2 [Funneliformis caledonium]